MKYFLVKIIVKKYPISISIIQMKKEIDIGTNPKVTLALEYGPNRAKIKIAEVKRITFILAFDSIKGTFLVLIR